jgi:hypothetical protein
MSKYLSRIGFFVFLSVVLTACHIGRKSTKEKVRATHKITSLTLDSAAVITDTDTASPTDAARLSPEKLLLLENLQPLFRRSIQFATFSGKAKMHYEGNGNKNEFTANIRMKKDSVIWISITALGGIMPVARILLTPDSIRMINYLQKEATLMPMSDGVKLLPVPVDFSALQNMIIGNALMQDGTPVDAADWADEWLIVHQDSSYRQEQVFSKTDSTMHSCQLNALANTGPTCMMQYRNYAPSPHGYFPNNRLLYIAYKGNHYTLDMNYNNFSFDTRLEFPFSIPRKYALKENK